MCVSVTQPSASITRGQSGAIALSVWSINWNPSSKDQVTITLTAQPSGEAPTFNNTICGTGNHTASCTIPAPGGTATPLEADLPVASNATSVQSVSLTAVLNPAGIKLPQPATATETAGVVAPASSSASASASSSAPASAAAKSSAPSSAPGSGANPSGTIGNIPVGPLPDLNGSATSYVGAGNASNLFPPIGPSASPSPAPGADGRSGRENAAPVANVSLLPLGMPVVTAQIIGLIVLALATMLAMTRLSLRRRPVPAARASALKESALKDDAAKPKD